MPGAIIVADQPTGAGAGVAGTSREDLWEDKDIELSVSTSGNTTYLWEMLDKPPGSAASLATPTGATSVFTPDVLGPYRIRLTTNGGGAGNVQILVLRVRFTNVGALAGRGWALPALGEGGTQENNYAGNVRGYDAAFRFIFADLLPWASGLTVQNAGVPVVGQSRTVNFVAGLNAVYNAGILDVSLAVGAKPVESGLTDLRFTQANDDAGGLTATPVRHMLYASGDAYVRGRYVSLRCGVGAVADDIDMLTCETDGSTFYRSLWDITQRDNASSTVGRNAFATRETKIELAVGNDTTTTLFSWTILDEAATIVDAWVVYGAAGAGSIATVWKRKRFKRDGGTVSSTAEIQVVANDVDAALTSAGSTTPPLIDNSTSTGRVRVQGTTAGSTVFGALIKRLELGL